MEGTKVEWELMVFSVHTRLVVLVLTVKLVSTVGHRKFHCLFIYLL